MAFIIVRQMSAADVSAEMDTILSDNNTTAEDDCNDEYYSPCSCRRDRYNNQSIFVVCSKASVTQVRDVFRRSTHPQMYSFSFLANHNDPPTTIYSVPVDFLADKRATRISLYGYSKGSSWLPKLAIDSLAFRSTKANVRFLELSYWDLLLQTDFSFLQGFHGLEQLTLSFNDNLAAFQYLPVPFPALRSLYIHHCSDLKQAPFPNLTLSNSNLEELSMPYNDLDDQTVNETLASLVAGGLSNSISSIDVSGNRLTTMPNQIAFFSHLTSLFVTDNSISWIASSSISLTSPHINMNFLHLNGNNIIGIESDAFKGNFSTTQVGLNFNRLTLFEENVFKDMLEQMVSIQPAIGSVIVSSNAFVCGCDLAWLIRDHRHLLPVVKGGVCSSRMSFEELDPQSFVGCLEQTTVDSLTTDNSSSAFSAATAKLYILQLIGLTFLAFVQTMQL